MQTATWAVTLAPQCSDWTTESRDATQGAEGAVEKEKLWVEGDRQRTIDATRSHNRMLFCRARDRLNQLVCHKFGSLKAMFNKFKVSESGVMSLDEFSAGLKRQKLENVFPREYQRIVFEALGQEYVERMQVHDLLNILNPDMDKYSQERVISFPLPEDAGLANRHRTFPDPTCVVDKPLLPDELHPIKSKIVDALFHKTRLEKRETGVQEQTEFLMNAFRQLDANMSGTLAPDEILMALGPRHLDLKLDNTELRRLVDFIGKSCDDGNTTDALISYKTFVRFLEITDIEPDYSPFFDHRNRELLALKRFSELPWQWNNPGWDENSLAPDHDIPEIAEAMRSKDADAVDQPYVRPMFSPQDLDAYNKRIAKMGTEDISEARRPLTSSGNIFADLRMTNRLKLLYTRPLFVSPPPTDWTRTGCGGNGISTESGLYLPSCERFITTSQSYFKPLRCNPNGSMSRDTVSDAEKVMNERKRRARARLAKNNSLHRDMAWRQRKREQMRFMNEEQKLLQKVRVARARCLLA